MNQPPLFTQPPVVAQHVFSMCRHDRHQECPVIIERRPSLQAAPMRHEVCVCACHEVTT